MMWSCDHMDSVQILSPSLSGIPLLSKTINSFFPPRIIVLNNAIHNVVLWRIINVNLKNWSVQKKKNLWNLYMCTFFASTPFLKWVYNSLQLFLYFLVFLFFIFWKMLYFKCSRNKFNWCVSCLWTMFSLLSSTFWRGKKMVRKKILLAENETLNSNQSEVSRLCVSLKNRCNTKCLSSVRTQSACRVAA